MSKEENLLMSRVAKIEKVKGCGCGKHIMELAKGGKSFM